MGCSGKAGMHCHMKPSQYIKGAGNSHFPRSPYHWKKHTAGRNTSWFFSVCWAWEAVLYKFVSIWYFTHSLEYVYVLQRGKIDYIFFLLDLGKQTSWDSLFTKSGHFLLERGNFVIKITFSSFWNLANLYIYIFFFFNLFFKKLSF